MSFFIIALHEKPTLNTGQECKDSRISRYPGKSLLHCKINVLNTLQSCRMIHTIIYLKLKLINI